MKIQARAVNIATGFSFSIEEKQKKKRQKREKVEQTFLEGFNLSTGAASGVDGLLVLLGGGVGCLLPDNHRFPVLGDVSDSCHSLSLSLSVDEEARAF